MCGRIEVVVELCVCVRRPVIESHVNFVHVPLL